METRNYRTAVQKALLRDVCKVARDRYAWPGGYPLALLMGDGESMCSHCVRENLKLIIDAELRETNEGGWRPRAVFINWEDADLQCCNCYKPIECAYGD